jgi:hypothetical protein
MTMSDITPPVTVGDGHLVLTEELRDRIRERLLTMLDVTTRRLERAGGDVEQEHPDPAGLIDAAEAIRAAVVKLDAGYFGICETCEGTIPFERLDALPSVRSCVACDVLGKPPDAAIDRVDT